MVRNKNSLEILSARFKVVRYVTGSYEEVIIE